MRYRDYKKIDIPWLDENSGKALESGKNKNIFKHIVRI